MPSTSGWVGATWADCRALRASPRPSSTSTGCHCVPRLRHQVVRRQPLIQFPDRAAVLPRRQLRAGNVDLLDQPSGAVVQRQIGGVSDLGCGLVDLVDVDVGDAQIQGRDGPVANERRPERGERFTSGGCRFPVLQTGTSLAPAHTSSPGMALYQNVDAAESESIAATGQFSTVGSNGGQMVTLQANTLTSGARCSTAGRV